MRYVSHEQGSAAWLAWRSGGIGASDAAIVLGLSPFKTAERLFQEMVGDVLPELSSYAMRRGQRLEPVAREEYERRHGFPMEPCCGEHEEMGWLRASLDGLSVLGDLVLEIKWPNFKAHEEALGGRVPEYYWPQVQHQLLVTGAEKLHYLSCSQHSQFEREDRFAIVEVWPDPEFIAYLVDEVGQFWTRVESARKDAAL
jgi:putative phage-type endonuclease